MSCVISYALLSLIIFIRNIAPFNLVPNDVFINSAISLLIGTIFAVAIAFVLINKRASNILTKFFYKSIHDDIWRDVFDFKNGSNLKIYSICHKIYSICHTE